MLFSSFLHRPFYLVSDRLMTIALTAQCLVLLLQRCQSISVIYERQAHPPLSHAGRRGHICCRVHSGICTYSLGRRVFVSLRVAVTIICRWTAQHRETRLMHIILFFTAFRQTYSRGSLRRTERVASQRDFLPLVVNALWHPNLAKQN